MGSGVVGAFISLDFLSHVALPTSGSGCPSQHGATCSQRASGDVATIQGGFFFARPGTQAHGLSSSITAPARPWLPDEQPPRSRLAAASGWRRKRAHVSAMGLKSEPQASGRLRPPRSDRCPIFCAKSVKVAEIRCEIQYFYLNSWIYPHAKSSTIIFGSSFIGLYRNAPKRP